MFVCVSISLFLNVHNFKQPRGKIIMICFNNLFCGKPNLEQANFFGCEGFCRICPNLPDTLLCDFCVQLFSHKNMKTFLV